MKNRLIFIVAVILCILKLPVLSFAQFDSATPAASSSGSSAQTGELEELYDKYEDQEVRQDQARKKSEKPPEPPKEMTKISELGRLAPFDDVAVIQRRFLPKTSRFEASGSGAISTNNAFFNNVGLGLRFAYYFQEKYGIEATYMFMSSSERPITKGLEKDQHIQTTSLVEPEAYYGVAFKWAPVYGKMAWLGEKIVPFDIYFTPGFGMTKTSLGENETTFSIGAGQLFALSKAHAIRWDFTWNFYSATTRYQDNGDTISKNDNHNDLLLSIGYSFFFPEATYR